MNYCYMISDGYICGVLESEQHFPNEITEEQKDEVVAMLCNRPSASDGFTYQLKADTLEWELVELPPVEEQDDEATESDYIEALNELGVEVDG